MKEIKNSKGRLTKGKYRVCAKNKCKIFAIAN
jgi:hypothetical protein